MADFVLMRGVVRVFVFVVLVAGVADPLPEVAGERDVVVVMLGDAALVVDVVVVLADVGLVPWPADAAPTHPTQTKPQSAATAASAANGRLWCPRRPRRNGHARGEREPILAKFY
jgi:hypothetical protein